MFEKALARVETGSIRYSPEKFAFFMEAITRYLPDRLADMEMEARATGTFSESDFALLHATVSGMTRAYEAGEFTPARITAGMSFLLSVRDLFDSAVAFFEVEDADSDSTDG